MTCAEEITDEDLKKLFQRIDLGRNGHVSYEEFRRFAGPGDGHCLQFCPRCLPPATATAYSCSQLFVGAAVRAGPGTPVVPDEVQLMCKVTNFLADHIADSEAGPASGGGKLSLPGLFEDEPRSGEPVSAGAFASGLQKIGLYLAGVESRAVLASVEQQSGRSFQPQLLAKDRVVEAMDLKHHGAEVARVIFNRVELRSRFEAGERHRKLWQSLPPQAQELLRKAELLASSAPAKAIRFCNEGIHAAVEKAHQSRGFLTGQPASLRSEAPQSSFAHVAAEETVLTCLCGAIVSAQGFGGRSATAQI